jgi:hypothetical protein
MRLLLWILEIVTIWLLVGGSLTPWVMNWNDGNPHTGPQVTYFHDDVVIGLNSCFYPQWTIPEGFSKYSLVAALHMNCSCE